MFLCKNVQRLVERRTLQANGSGNGRYPTKGKDIVWSVWKAYSCFEKRVRKLRSLLNITEPYICYIDNVNRDNPQGYKNNNLEVSMTNLCCLGQGTKVVTKEGAVSIEELIGRTVTIWDGKEWVDNSGFKLVDISPIWEIQLENGTTIEATHNHRWFVANEFKKPGEPHYLEKHTDQLQSGDLLEGHSKGLEEYGANTKGFYIVKSVTKTNRIAPVYCTNVPSTSKFALANGVMTGNSEITLYTDPEHSFVCCLSSLNLAKYHEWADTDLVETAIWFLDGVLEEFIQRAKDIPGLECAVRFSQKGRAIGLGVLGWHTFLQQEGLPFDSKEATQYTVNIFKNIREKAEYATSQLALEYGEPEWCVGTGRRNSHLLALAPTVSNSKLSGDVSPSIEPWAANIFVEQSAKGTFIRKNAVLAHYLKQLGLNTDTIWDKIMEAKGSVQSIAELEEYVIQDGYAISVLKADHTKPFFFLRQVFKTFKEINQIQIVRQQAARQPYIDQAVSLNLRFPHNAPPKFVSDVHMEAWRLGVKTLYYFRSESVLNGELKQLTTTNNCSVCEG